MPLKAETREKLLRAGWALAWLAVCVWAYGEHLRQWAALTYVAFGFGVAEIVGTVFVTELIRRVAHDIKYQYDPQAGQMPFPTFYGKDRWYQDVINRTPGGPSLGAIERAIFFASLVGGSWALGGSWLLLKAASKWKSWTTTVDMLKRRGDPPLEDVRAGLARTALDHRTFLVGTGANIVAALLGYAAMKALLGNVFL